jgi:hypothetical protein
LKILDFSQNVYVHVTYHTLFLKMFMWMLHLWYHNEGWKIFSKCSCECYICGVNLKLEDSHVKITYYCQILKMFMWMLHIIVRLSKCLCECCINGVNLKILDFSQNVYVHHTMCYISLSDSQNVYANVASMAMVLTWSSRFPQMSVWMLHEK